MHKRPSFLWLFPAAILAVASLLPATSPAEPIQIADIKRDSQVDFEKEILPVFRRNCLACHSATEAQSDLVLESPQTILKGGAEGPSVVPGKGSESRLLLLASKQKEPHMPPEDNDVKAKPLTSQELGLLKLWIDQGAKGDVKSAAEITWQPLPPGINPIYSVAITPDGQYAAASRANQIFLFHVPSKRELGRLTDPALTSGRIYQQPGVADLDLIQSLKFSPDGTLLASGGFRTVKLWRKTVGQVSDLPGKTPSTTITFGPNNSRTATAQINTIRISQTDDDKELKALDHGSPITSLAASSDGKRLASSGSSGAAKLWDLESSKLVADLKGDIRATIKVGEATRAASLAKKHIELAKKDLEDANARKKAEEENKTKSAEALSKAETELKPKEEAAKKAGEEKAAGEKALADATAAKAKADESKKTAEELLARSQEAIKSLKASQDAAAKIDSEDGKAAQGAVDKSLAEVESLRSLIEQQKTASEKSAEQAAKTLEEADKKAKDLAAAAQKAIDDQTAAQRTLETAKRGVQRAEESVKKATDAIPSFEALVKTAEEVAKTREEGLAKATAAAKESEQPIRSIAFSPDSATVFTVGSDDLIHTWDAATGAPIEVLAGTKPGPGALPATGDLTIDWKLERTIGAPDSTSIFADRVTALDFSPDGKTLAVGSGEPSRSGEIKLFDIATGNQTLALKDPHSDTVNCLAVSPDGQQLASCAADRFIKLWNVADGKFIRSFEGHTHHVLGVAWRADGRVLASSGADLVLKVWDARTGDQLRTVQNQFTKEVTSVSFVSDDLVVASGGDSKVRLINSSNGNNQRDLSGATEYMYSAAASADGKTIIAGGLDSVLRIWNDQGQEQAKFAPPAKTSNDRTAAK